MFSQVQKSPVGVQLYSFREQFKTDVSGTLKKIKQRNLLIILIEIMLSTFDN
jgi:hypothetical protein